MILCQMMGRAIVLVRDDQLSLAIGKRGQNVRLASKLCGWDIEIMTQVELESQIDRAVRGFCDIEGVNEDLANQLVGEGYLSYDDLSVIEPTDLIAMGELTEEDVDKIVDEAEKRALVAEKQAEEAKKLRKQQQAIEKAAEEARAKEEAAQKAAQRKAELEAGGLKAPDSTPEAQDSGSDEGAATGAADAAKTE